ncbi:MAG: metallophosphoesterase [Elusimicrobiota bacterium]|nr:metallophosphoesterase [Elusimicrobiota bacterium]
MRILFVTDLHGNEIKYRRVLANALKHGATAVVNGGDMLPLHGDPHGSQNDFVEGLLSWYFSEHTAAGLAWLGLLGNDDLKIHDAVFDGICRKHRNIFNLAQRRVEHNGFEFIGMNWVTDYPFRLKDRCRRDGPGWNLAEHATAK